MANPIAIAEQALTDYFSDFAAGDDVPPARRYHLEGYLQALIDAGQLTPSGAQDLLVKLCRKCLGDAAADLYRTNPNSQPTVVLHSHMPRAPVYPSG